MEKRSRRGKMFFSCNRYPALPLRDLGSADSPEPCPSAAARPFVVEKTDQARRARVAPLPERGAAQYKETVRRAPRREADVSASVAPTRSSAAASPAARPPGSCARRRRAGATSTRCGRCAATAAHQTDRLAELVCSNSFRNAPLETAVGLLKEEMRRLGSLVMRVRRRARACRRAPRSRSTASASPTAITARDRGAAAHRARARGGDRRSPTASSSSPPARSPRRRCRTALQRAPRPAAPLLLRRHRADRHRRLDRPRRSPSPASRYGKGGDDYLNCPLDRDEYYAFVDAVLARGEGADARLRALRLLRGLHADRGDGAPRAATRSRSARCGRSGWSIRAPAGGPSPSCRLRQDDAEATLYNMVGFQTKMTYPEQRRVLRMIPGLEQRRVRAPRQPAPQHVHQLAGASCARRCSCAAAHERLPRRAARSASRATSSRRPAASSPASTPARLLARRAAARAAADAPRSARCSPT